MPTLGVSGGILLAVLLFFVKAGSFVFGGLAVVPFLDEVASTGTAG